MLRAPSVFEMKAKGVGMQTWNVLLNRRRKSLVGVQWSGSAGWNAVVLSHDMVTLKVETDGVIDTRCGDVFVVQRYLSRRRLLPDMYKTEGDLVDCNVPTTCLPEVCL